MSGPSSTTPDVPASAHPHGGSRPRVVGERETEILRAAVDVLRDVGYDRLTFDAVAAAARASKATLYRRWPNKRELVVDAVGLLVGCPAERDPNTGSLRGDLIGQACADGGLDDAVVSETWAALLPVIHRDPELATELHARFIAPKTDAARVVLRNAQQRGELGPDADLETLLSILPALSIHEAMLSGKRPGPERITQLVDTVVLPACAATLSRSDRAAARPGR
ncbi:TetR family transcriptional regulator [Humibacillus sp. DSM 29435]|uniref:TetR/AcrR family transcriptional regulator n=1 Tax=Humibacillus sp. DSM 29435 TaxID=1869167 RepID=UPI00087312EA|nr:TetR/AcrR family transcriptional regulator [Humibacillus sp. DSM 29435]OFE15732.1 TetR family transcriptional regulator [Humibacillus sp. DSM 29435]